MNRRIKELDQKNSKILEEISILAHARASVLQALADEIHKEYGDKIIELEEVFALGISVTNDPESFTSNCVQISVEPAFRNDLSMKEEMDKQKDLRQEIYNEVPELREIETSIHVYIEMIEEEEEE